MGLESPAAGYRILKKIVLSKIIVRAVATDGLIEYATFPVQEFENLPVCSNTSNRMNGIISATGNLLRLPDNNPVYADSEAPKVTLLTMLYRC